MKVPLIWLQDYVDIEDQPVSKIADAFTQIGLMLDKPLDESRVLDLEHRMDRSDWLSILGCARDLAAYLDLPLTVPRAKLGHLKSKSLIPITVQTPHVRRFKTRVIQGVKVGPSPSWLADRLKAYGIESKNNIVDITNFCMVELGQPMHAQDLATLKEPEITLRAAKKNESITTLLGTKVQLTPDIFILSSGGVPTVIGGIVGGQTTGVTESTTDILLDAGNYDQTIIRKNSRSLKILNESVARYDKFLDPRAIDLALDRATALILELAGGEAIENGDYYPTVVTPTSQKLRYSRLELLSGGKFSATRVKQIFKQLGYTILEESPSGLTLEVPYHRTDVEVEDDLVADILRISDYNNLTTLALSTPAPTEITSSLTRFEDKLRDHLTSLGAHEHITSSLVKGDGSKSQVVLANALSTDQNALRLSLIPSLEQIVTNYAKHNLEGVTVYEIGKVFASLKELRHLSVVARRDVRDTLSSLLASLGITTFSIGKKLDIEVAGQRVGTLHHARAFTLDTSSLLTQVIPYSGVVSEYSHASVLDLSLKLPKTLLFADIDPLIRQSAPDLTSLTVPDQHQGWILVRLTFAKQLDNSSQVMAKVLASLKARGVATRSDLPSPQS